MARSQIVSFFFTSVVLLSSLTAAGQASAQLPELGLPSTLNGTATSARFLGGASADGGNSYRNTFGFAEPLSVTAAIQVEQGHVGSNGNIYLVVAWAGQLFMRDIAGQFLAWNGNASTLLPTLANKNLELVEPLPIIADAAFGPAGVADTSLQFFLAYNLSGSAEQIYYSGSPLVVTIAAQTTEEQTFSTPVALNIFDYTDHAMEPFISRDGATLFFNNLNDPSVNTNLHYATRVDATTFQYRGELGDVNTAQLEGVPTMAADGRFVYTSASDEGQAQRSLLREGSYSEGIVENAMIIAPAPLHAAGSVAMGGELSADGDTLYIVESVFTGNPVPESMDLHVAQRVGFGWQILDNSNTLMAALNSDELEYAPAISVDQLTLYFTRAEELAVGNEVAGTALRILMATRDSVELPFREPIVVDEIQGFVEGPTIGPDGEVYFHKKVDGVFRLFVTAPQ